MVFSASVVKTGVLEGVTEPVIVDELDSNDPPPIWSRTLDCETTVASF